ncbi:MAG: hypothetical protein BHW65_07655 [Verrucomicrobia bacterium CAG:312_58_20]|nr:MAG: hypothetical protein BHW65_07655 [Verrucomicrobia bacterium CAG:312_58_20]
MRISAGCFGAFDFSAPRAPERRGRARVPYYSEAAENFPVSGAGKFAAGAGMSACPSLSKRPAGRQLK